MIGQETIKTALKSFTAEEFPRTILLLGEDGCGKHLMVSEIISPHLSLEVIDITNNISFDYLLEIQLRAIPAIYLIDVDQLTDKQQNVILKFIEEPVSNSYIVLLGENKMSILDTVINRCVVYTFEPYSNDSLKLFIGEIDINMQELILKVCRTPGQVMNLGLTKINELQELCLKMSLKLSTANFANTLTIAQKINYKDKDEPEKFDINVFFNVLLLVLYEDYIKNNNLLSYKLYYKVVEYKTLMSDTRLNREYLVENMLSSLWKLARE